MCFSDKYIYQWFHGLSCALSDTLLKGDALWHVLLFTFLISTVQWSRGRADRAPLGSSHRLRFILLYLLLHYQHLQLCCPVNAFFFFGGDEVFFKSTIQWKLKYVYCIKCNKHISTFLVTAQKLRPSLFSYKIVWTSWAWLTFSNEMIKKQNILNDTVSVVRFNCLVYLCPLRTIWYGFILLHELRLATFKKC